MQQQRQRQQMPQALPRTGRVQPVIQDPNLDSLYALPGLGGSSSQGQSMIPASSVNAMMQGQWQVPQNGFGPVVFMPINMPFGMTAAQSSNGTMPTFSTAVLQQLANAMAVPQAVPQAAAQAAAQPKPRTRGLLALPDDLLLRILSNLSQVTPPSEIAV